MEITQNLRHAQLTKWESTTDIKKYESLLENAKEKENFKDDYLQEKVDSRIEDHLRKLGYETSKNHLSLKPIVKILY